jgi:hypothetical protein
MLKAVVATLLSGTVCLLLAFAESEWLCTPLWCPQEHFFHWVHHYKQGSSAHITVTWLVFGYKNNLVFVTVNSRSRKRGQATEL